MVPTRHLPPRVLPRMTHSPDRVVIVVVVGLTYLAVCTTCAPYNPCIQKHAPTTENAQLLRKMTQDNGRIVENLYLLLACARVPISGALQLGIAPPSCKQFVLDKYKHQAKQPKNATIVFSFWSFSGMATTALGSHQNVHKCW